MKEKLIYWFKKYQYYGEAVENLEIMQNFDEWCLKYIFHDGCTLDTHLIFKDRINPIKVEENFGTQSTWNLKEECIYYNSIDVVLLTKDFLMFRNG